MKSKRIISKSSSKALRTKPVQQVIASLTPDMHELVFEIKRRMKELEGVEEKVMYDGLVKEEVPAFNLGKRQLFHLHIESEKHRRGLAGTISINVNDFEPYLLDSHIVSQRLKKMVAGQKIYRGAKWVFIPLNNMDEVEEFLDLVQLKYEFYKYGGE
ncbi:MAG: hypothetical protein A2145_05155 [candidate division Zixibacteria bacterium RBG_16_40_9]|nr:MAG: hypothetical protein A2145_05155 [candidate division Zixibacteria bacterium RBG_16_40_9]